MAAYRTAFGQCACRHGTLYRRQSRGLADGRGPTRTRRATTRISRPAGCCSPTPAITTILVAQRLPGRLPRWLPARLQRRIRLALTRWACTLFAQGPDRTLDHAEHPVRRSHAPIGFSLWRLTAGLTCACAGQSSTLENGRNARQVSPSTPRRSFSRRLHQRQGSSVEVTLVRIPDRTQEPIYAREVRLGQRGCQSTSKVALKSAGGKSDSQAADTGERSAHWSAQRPISRRRCTLRDPKAPAFRLYSRHGQDRYAWWRSSRDRRHRVIWCASLPSAFMVQISPRCDRSGTRDAVRRNHAGSSR